MNFLALQEAADEYYEVIEPHWTDFIALPLALLVAFLLLFWVVRQLKRAMSQNNEVLDLNRECIQVSRDAVEVTKQSIELQQENNRLLAELNDTLRNRPAK